MASSGLAPEDLAAVQAFDAGVQSHMTSVHDVQRRASQLQADYDALLRQVSDDHTLEIYSVFSTATLQFVDDYGGKRSRALGHNTAKAALLWLAEHRWMVGTRQLDAAFLSHSWVSTRFLDGLRKLGEQTTLGWEEAVTEITQQARATIPRRKKELHFQPRHVLAVLKKYTATRMHTQTVSTPPQAQPQSSSPLTSPPNHLSSPGDDSTKGQTRGPRQAAACLKLTLKPPFAPDYDPDIEVGRHDATPLEDGYPGEDVFEAHEQSMSFFHSQEDEIGLQLNHSAYSAAFEAPSSSPKTPSPHSSRPPSQASSVVDEAQGKDEARSMTSAKRAAVDEGSDCESHALFLSYDRSYRRCHSLWNSVTGSDAGFDNITAEAGHDLRAQQMVPRILFALGKRTMIPSAYLTYDISAAIFSAEQPRPEFLDFDARPYLPKNPFMVPPRVKKHKADEEAGLSWVDASLRTMHAGLYYQITTARELIARTENEESIAQTMVGIANELRPPVQRSLQTASNLLANLQEERDDYMRAMERASTSTIFRSSFHNTITSSTSSGLRRMIAMVEDVIGETELAIRNHQSLFDVLQTMQTVLTHHVVDEALLGFKAELQAQVKEYGEKLVSMSGLCKWDEDGAQQEQGKVPDKDKADSA